MINKFTHRFSASRGLNMKVGLFEVKPGFYQVRGYDLANITFVKTECEQIMHLMSEE